MKATEKEIAILLERAGMPSLDTDGSRSKAAAQGGIVAQIFVRNADNPELSIIIDEVRASAHFPIDEKRIDLMLETLLEHHAIPQKKAFAQMLTHLLINTARMFLASRATSLTLGRVHLHDNGYHIGEVELLHEGPLHLKPRAESTGRDSIFTHTGRR